MKNRLWALGAVLAVLVGVFTPTPGGAQTVAPEARDITVSVMTYNIHAGLGSDGRLDFDRTAGAIRASGAEIIGLQEVDVHWSGRSDFLDEARLLAEELGMNYFFAPIYSFDPIDDGEPRREFGLAILTPYPITYATNHEITRLSTQSSDPEPEPAPGFPEVVVNVRGASVHVYATHLDYRADPRVRAMQVADMQRITREDPSPKILVGDFNAPPDAAELMPLWHDFADAWDAAGAGSGYTFPATEPVKRIDYVTASPGVEIVSAEVVRTLASDHLPVVADLVLQRGGTRP